MKRIALIFMASILLAQPALAGYRGDIVKDSTDVFMTVFLRGDDDGKGEGGVAFGDVACHYERTGQAADSTVVNVISGTKGSHANGGWIATGNVTGAYQFQPPDGAFATGAGSVTFFFIVSGVLDQAETFVLTDGISSLIGTPVALDGGAATIAGMLTKMVDDNDGADFDAGLHALKPLREAITAAGPQENSADDGEIVTGTDTANAYTDTKTANDIAWQIAGASAVGGFGVNTSFTYNLGTTNQANLIIVRAKESLIGVVHIWAWDYENPGWVQLSDSGSAISGNSYGDHSYALPMGFQRISDGEVQLRFTGTGTATNKYLWIDKVVVSTDVVGSLTASEIADTVWAHNVKDHTGHDRAGFFVSQIVPFVTPITAADTALSFTAAGLPATTNFYQFHFVGVHDEDNDVTGYSWIASMTDSGVVTLGRALPFTPGATNTELYIFGPFVEMRGTDDAPTASENAAEWGIGTPTAGGVLTRDEILTWCTSMAAGKFVKAGNVYTFYDDDDATVLFVLTITDGGRTN